MEKGIAFKPAKAIQNKLIGASIITPSVSSSLNHNHWGNDIFTLFLMMLFVGALMTAAGLLVNPT